MFLDTCICKTLFCIILTYMKYAKSHTKQRRQAFFQQNEVASFLSHHVDLSIQFMPYFSDFQLMQLDLTQFPNQLGFFIFLSSTCCRVAKAVILTLCFFVYVHICFMLGKMLSMKGTLMHFHCNYSSASCTECCGKIENIETGMLTLVMSIKIY